MEPWVLALTRRNIEVLQPDNPAHVSVVAGLIGRLPGAIPPDAAGDARRIIGLARERLKLAGQVCRWAGSPERLARWLVRVAGRHGPTSLGAYLRRASERGDPGTVLEGGTVARVGRASETWHDFTPATERALEGPHAAGVQKLVAGVGLNAATIDEGQRQELRTEMRLYLEQDRPEAARAVLLKLVGTDHSDLALQRAVDGILTLTQARSLLGAA